MEIIGHNHGDKQHYNGDKRYYNGDKRHYNGDKRNYGDNGDDIFAAMDVCTVHYLLHYE